MILRYNLKLTLFALFLVVAFYFTHSEVVAKSVVSFLSYRRIEVVGNSWLTTTEILDWLPNSKDTLWWYGNVDVVKLHLIKHPLIKAATVNPCMPKTLYLRYPVWLTNSWGCFRISVEERQPRFRVAVGKREWLTDTEGVLLAVAPSGNQSKRFSEFPLLKGVVGSLSSPDETRARITFLINKTLALQAETGRYVQRIEFLDRGEMLVAFEALSFPVRFGSELHNLPGEFTKVSLLDQVKRMETLIPRVENEKKIRELDLGFNKFAIVRRYGEVTTHSSE
jgi:hypothetical protein